MKALASIGYGYKEEFWNEKRGDRGILKKWDLCAVLLLAYLNPQAVLVDMEEGVVNEILQGALRDVFDSTQLLTDVSGSGNNWWETDWPQDVVYELAWLEATLQLKPGLFTIIHTCRHTKQSCDGVLKPPHFTYTTATSQWNWSSLGTHRLNNWGGFPILPFLKPT